MAIPKGSFHEDIPCPQEVLQRTEELRSKEGKVNNLKVSHEKKNY